MNDLSLNPPSNRFDKTVDRRARDDARDEREADRFEERLEEAKKADQAREEERRGKDAREPDREAGWAPTARPLRARSVTQGSGSMGPLGQGAQKGGAWMTAFSQIAPLSAATSSPSSPVTETLGSSKPEAKPAPVNPKGGEFTPSTKGETTPEVTKAKAVVRTEQALDPRGLETPEGLITKAKVIEEGDGVRVHVDRDLAVEVAWQAEGLEVRIDGTVDAVDPMKELESAMQDMLGRNGANLLDYSTHIRAAEEQEALKSENQTTDETHNDLAHRVLQGNLVNVVA